MTAVIVNDGRMANVRAWYGQQCHRGAQVRVHGRKARVLSARDGKLYVRIWATGERIAIVPSEAVAL